MTDTAPIGLNDWRRRGRCIKLGGRSIFVVDEGQGEVVLCIHGFPTASWDWSWVWRGLTARYRVIAPDLLGFGFSEKPSNHRYSLFEQADLVEMLLHRFQVKRAHVFCHDYGDTVGQELLARQRAGSSEFDIRTLCFLNGGLIPGAHRPRLIQRLLASPAGALVGRLTSESRFNRSFSGVFSDQHQPSREELASFWALVNHNNGRRVMHRLIRYLRERVRYRERWVGAMQETRLPLQLINGIDDPVSGGHMVDQFARLVPGAGIVSLNGIGHYPQVEAPQATFSAWSAFSGKHDL